MREVGRQVIGGIALVLIAAVAGCGTGAAKDVVARPVSNPGVWWSSSLALASLSDTRRELAKPFDDTFPVARVSASGVPEAGQVSNCQEYFEKTEQGFQAVSDQDFALLRTIGARCYALRLLTEHGPALREPPVSFDWRQTGLGGLPPAMGPGPNQADGAGRAAATGRGVSWKAFEPDAHLESHSPHTATVRATGWSVVLDAWAVGDLDGTGAVEILVFTSATGTEGSWREIKLRVLDSASRNGVLPILREFKL